MRVKQYNLFKNSSNYLIYFKAYQLIEGVESSPEWDLNGNFDRVPYLDIKIPLSLTPPTPRLLSRSSAQQVAWCACVLNTFVYILFMCIVIKFLSDGNTYRKMWLVFLGIFSFVFLFFPDCVLLVLEREGILLAWQIAGLQIFHVNCQSTRLFP